MTLNDKDGLTSSFDDAKSVVDDFLTNEIQALQQWWKMWVEGLLTKIDLIW